VKHRNDPGVAGKDAKIALNARQIDLIDLAGKQQALRRYMAHLKV
jgi:hypothetical protein